MSTLVAISGLGIICLLLEILNLRKILIPFTVVALLGILGMTIAEFNASEPFFNFGVDNMIITSRFSMAFSSLFIVLATLIIAMSHKFYENNLVKIADYVSLKVFMLAGAVAMVAFGNLAMFFIGLEVLSIAGYVLASSFPLNKKSNEAGMKYFIMGAFASSFILFGIALVYGAIGSFDIATIVSVSAIQGGSLPIWFNMGFVMILVGLMFKASVAPFHFWAPDVYEGSPTLTTALMSTLVKVTAIASLYKIVMVLFVGMTPEVKTIIIVLSILSLLIGNVTALKQINMKRMMAYSGISHAGFMIMNLLAGGEGASNILYYAAAYSLAALAGFSVILAVSDGKDNENIENIFGLGKRNPVLAIVMACAMMSLGGIPIFAGFFAKMFTFQQMLGINNILLVICGIIFSIVAICYYFGVVNVMYTKKSNDEAPLKVSAVYQTVAVIAIVLNILLGLFPSIIMGLKL